MLIELGMLMIERVYWGVVFIWVIILSPGWAKSKILSHYPLQKLSTSLLETVAPNFYGCKNSSMITIFVKKILPSTVTIPMPSTSLRIRFNILELNTEIRHHFIWELVEDGTLTLEFIHTDDQKADLFTKPLDNKRFEFLRQNIGVISMDWSLYLLLPPHAFASSFYVLLFLTCFCLFFVLFIFFFI